MWSNRGPLRTILVTAVMLISLLFLFGCSDDDPAAPGSSDSGIGTVEIKMPDGATGANWHLYGPGDSFRHGDGDEVLKGLPAGQYTIIWTAVKGWTNPMPTKVALKADQVLTLRGDYLDKAPGSDFSRIEASDFIMGSDNGTRAYPVEVDTVLDGRDTTIIIPNYFPAEVGRDSDENRHRVQINYDYYMGKTEITNQEFVELGNWALSQGHATVTESAMFDNLDGSTVELINFDFEDTPVDVQEGVLRLKKPEFANRPIIEITWYGAASYCDWLSLDEGVDRAYDHDTWTLVRASYRLPYEAEWENACRAGTQTAFHSGDAVNGSCDEPGLDPAGWFCGNAGNASHDVGTKAANAFDLYDMHGNVWEWCHSFYGRYQVPDLPVDEDGVPLLYYDDEDLIPLLNPRGPDEGELRVIRSGRWLLSSAMCRSAGRMMGAPDYRGFHIGFRVAYREPATQ